MTEKPGNSDEPKWLTTDDVRQDNGSVMYDVAHIFLRLTRVQILCERHVEADFLCEVKSLV